MGRKSQALAVLVAALVLAVAAQGAAWSQGVTLPPSGGNQHSTVVQGIGLVKVSIDYSSPHVHTAAGVDRRGKIWGDNNLVPYGMSALGFGSCGKDCPWRGGANENTVFTTSHDIKVQGQLLPAGTYGLHFIPGRDEWTVIFSKNSTSWGSFFYDAKEDALRVTAKPAKSDYHEDLAYGFRDRGGDHATAVLSWEDLEVPFTITVDNANDLWVENLRHELRSTGAFSWMGFSQAANFCLQNKTHLDQGLKWAQDAVGPVYGQVNFTTLSTLANLQDANGMSAESRKTFDRAVHDPTATPVDLHLYGRALLAAKKTDEAMAVFQLNAKLHPNAWPVHVGLGRGYAALGRRADAISEFKLAVAQAPDDNNRNNLQDMIKKLEAGKDI